jgi:uncharacterized protein YjiS (DUF1127 family)
MMMTNYIGALAKPIGPRSMSLPRLLRRMTARWLSSRRRRRDHADLMRQPDYLLRDIGMERHEIERLLRGRTGVL